MRPAEHEASRLRALSAGLGLGPVEPPFDAAREDPADAADLDLLYGRVLDAVGAPPADDVAPLRRRTARRRPPARRLLPRVDLRAAAAAVAALALVGALWLSQSPPASAEPPVLRFSAADGQLAPDSGGAARDALLDIADAAAQQPPQPRTASATTQHVVTDRWRLEVDTDAAGEGHRLIRPTHNDSWLYADGRIRYREVATGASFSPDGRLDAPASDGGGVGAEADAQRGDVVRDEVMPAHAERGARWASELPRDPDALRELWLRWADDPAVVDPTSPSVVVVHEIAALFDTYVVPPDLAAAAWMVLAGQDDVRDLGAVTDRAGRPGRGFGVWDPNASALEVLVVDPSTGALLGAEYVLVEPGTSAAPVVGSFTLYRLSEWTSER